MNSGGFLLDYKVTLIQHFAVVGFLPLQPEKQAAHRGEHEEDEKAADNDKGG